MINIVRSLSMLYFNAESICRDPRKMHASVRHSGMHKTVNKHYLPWIASDHLILRHTIILSCWLLILYKTHGCAW